MKPIVVEVRGPVPAAIETVFDVFLKIDLSTILLGYGPLPAVVAVADQTGEWDEIGQSRFIRLADGHEMLETLLVVDPPRHFAYDVSELTNVLRFLVRRFRGAWTFEESTLPGGATVTLAHWRYEFAPRSRLARPLARLILHAFWRPTMERALELASAQAVAKQAEDAPRTQPASAG